MRYNNTVKVLAKNVTQIAVGLYINRAWDNKLAKNPNPGMLNRFMRRRLKFARGKFNMGTIIAVSAVEVYLAYKVDQLQAITEDLELLSNEYDPIADYELNGNGSYQDSYLGPDGSEYESIRPHHFINQPDSCFNGGMEHQDSYYTGGWCEWCKAGVCNDEDVDVKNIDDNDITVTYRSRYWKEKAQFMAYMKGASLTTLETVLENWSRTPNDYIIGIMGEFWARLFLNVIAAELRDEIMSR